MGTAFNPSRVLAKSGFFPSHLLTPPPPVLSVQENSLPYAGWTRAYVSNLHLAFNTITSASFNTVFLDTTDLVHVESNVFYHDTPRELFVAGTT